MITTQSVSNGNPTLGSIWQSFANQFYEQFSRQVLLVNAAKGGTYFCTTGTVGSPTAVAANSWGSGGDLRSAFNAKVALALRFNGYEKLDLIVVNLGINDIRNGYATGTILTEMVNFFTYLTTTYPTTQIICISPGRDETTISTDVESRRILNTITYF